jgi:hypothetical protein
MEASWDFDVCYGVDCTWLGGVSLGKTCKSVQKVCRNGAWFEFAQMHCFYVSAFTFVFGCLVKSFLYKGIKMKD